VRLLAAIAIVLAGLLACLVSGCERAGPRWLFGPFAHAAPAAETLTWTSQAGDALDVIESQLSGAVTYVVALPPNARATGLRRVELRFHDPLNGARVDAHAIGASGRHPLLDGRRIGGDTVAIPVPPLDLDRLQLTVHHHLRPLPVVAEVRFGRSAHVAAGE
jgi:hypothetical protein